MRVSKIAVATLALSLAAGLSAVAIAQQQRHGRLQARLGDRVEGQRGPGGRVLWGGTPEEGKAFRVHVGGFDLPPGTTMAVTACGVDVGSLELRAGRGDHSGGRLHLSVRKGDAVPACKPGDAVSVSGGGVTLQGQLHKGRGR